MSERLSVKGLIVCTPEFHAIAKKGEEQFLIMERMSLDLKMAEIERECYEEYLSEVERVIDKRTINGDIPTEKYMRILQKLNEWGKMADKRCEVTNE